MHEVCAALVPCWTAPNNELPRVFRLGIKPKNNFYQKNTTDGRYFHGVLAFRCSTVPYFLCSVQD